MSDAPASPAQIQHVASDGVALVIDQYRARARAHAHVLVVHGYLEHAGRYARFANALCQQGIDCSVLELRGHGRSGGKRAHVDVFSRYVDDVREVLAALRPPTDDKSNFLFGHSLGGLIAAHAAAPLGAQLCGVLLSNPYLGNAVAIPAAKRWLGQVAHRYVPTLKAPAGLKREWMSRDEEALRAMANDGAIQRFATAGWFHEVSRAQTEVAGITQVSCPVWVGIGDADPVASPMVTRQFAERLVAPAKCVRVYPGALHELLQDTIALEVQEDIAHWLTLRSGVSTSA